MAIEGSVSARGAQIRDLQELTSAMRAVLDKMRRGDKESAETSLRFARGLVNVSSFLEPHAKAILTSVFAEIHSILDPSSTDCDVLFDNFLRSMEFIYGPEHIVMSDCFTMLSSFYATNDRIPLAIEYAGRALVNRIAAVGLMHFATANSHYNLGLLYRLNGELLKSKKEFRICRSIRSELFGEESLEVAMTDLSLGQTERLLISYDKSYLHFYLSFHTRAVILGPNHPDTIRSYRLLSDIRYAYSDRLLTSVELLDRIDELGWFYLGDDEGDLFSVVSSLLTHLYAARATALQNGLTMHYKGGIETVGGNTGTMLGDCIVLRQSLLESLIRESVTQRIQSVMTANSISSLINFVPQVGTSSQGAVTDWNHRLSQRGRAPPPPASRYISRAFNSLAYIEEITKEIIAWLLNDNPRVLIRNPHDSPNRFGSVKGSVPVIPLVLTTDQINYYEQKRIAKLKADEAKEKPLGIKQKTKETVEKKLEAILSVVGQDEETKLPTPLEKPPPDPVFLPPKTPPPPLRGTSLTKLPATSSKQIEKKIKNDKSESNSLPPDVEKHKVSQEVKKGSKATRRSEMKQEPIKKISTTPESIKISVKEIAVPPKLLVNRNKAFLGIDEEISDPLHPKIRDEEANLPQVMPRLGDRKVLLTRDFDGKSVSIRPVAGKDILQGLRLKIFAAGIFPYLLMTDLEEVERSKREILSPMPLMERKSVRFQAEEMIKEIDRLKREEEAKRLDEERLIAEKKEAEEKAEVEEAKVKKEEEEKKQMEKAKKPIPRPPPLPSCWPPQVVNGKNVGGDGAPGAFGMPSDGGGRGGLLSALMGGRGGGGRGGPLAILRRKSGTMLKPPVPKLKQLHWDTLESTEGTLWAEDSSTLGMAIPDDAFADLAEVFAPAQKKDPATKAAKDMPGAIGLPGGKNKPVAVLDGQKSQNMNIMLAKFGSKTKLSEILEAVVSLNLASFTLGILNTMLDYTPAAFAETGEVESIKTAIATHGIDKLGKAERYLFELSKIPRVDSYLRVMSLLLSIEDIKKQTHRAATVIFSVVEEIRGSNRLKILFQSILRIGNVLNQGTKKSGASGFKIASLSKLTQTKSNSGETVLEYLVVRMGRDMPDVLDIKADMPSLEEAKYVSFPTLQMDVTKIENGLKVLQKHREDMRVQLEKEENPTTGCTQEIYQKVCKYETDVTQVLGTMKDEMLRAQQYHAELCQFLGEDPKQDPEGLYGQILSFVCSLEAVIAKKLKRL